MSRARMAKTTLKFNGQNVEMKLKEYLESASYTDVASGSSDTLSVRLHNIDKKWITAWYPHKGDEVEGSIRLLDWNKAGKDIKIYCGSFTLDDVKFSGNPMALTLDCVSAPASESFQTRERNKTWENVSISGISGEIAGRYSLALDYSGPAVKIKKLEQSESDSAFLYNLCKSYGLSMKVYKKKLVIYDQGQMEAKPPVGALKMDDFVDNNWDAVDTLYGVYTGARIAYKNPDDNKETSIYVGLKSESGKGSRTLKINETADSVAEARAKAAAQVNLSNQQATTISGEIWPDPKICAGVTVNVSGFGKFNGKYFVDKSTLDVGEGGTSQKIEMHKCQARVSA